MRRFRRGLLLALLMTSVAGAAFAAKGPSADATRDAKIQQLEQQMTVFQSEIDDLKSQGVSPATVAALQSQLNAFGQQIADLKSATDTNTADIATLKIPPAGTSVTVTLPNGKPQLATADGRFTANVRSTIQFDAANYIQRSPGPVSSDFRRSGTGDANHARKLRDGTEFRRARLGVDGKVFGDFDYEAIYEFGGYGAEDAGHVFALTPPHPGILKPFDQSRRVQAEYRHGGLHLHRLMPLMERPSPAGWRATSPPATAQRRAAVRQRRPAAAAIREYPPTGWPRRRYRADGQHASSAEPGDPRPALRRPVGLDRPLRRRPVRRQPLAGAPGRQRSTCSSRRTAPDPTPPAPSPTVASPPGSATGRSCGSTARAWSTPAISTPRISGRSAWKAASRCRTSTPRANTSSTASTGTSTRRRCPTRSSTASMSKAAG